MIIKKGDKVKILTGKDKGKTGKVLQVFPGRGKASIEGLNLLIKHLRPRKQGEQGQRVEFPAPLSISNVMLVCPKCGKPSRTGRNKQSDPALIKDTETAGKKFKTKKTRICRRCSQAID